MLLLLGSGCGNRGGSLIFLKQEHFPKSFPQSPHTFPETRACLKRLGFQTDTLVVGPFVDKNGKSLDNGEIHAELYVRPVWSRSSFPGGSGGVTGDYLSLQFFPDAAGARAEQRWEQGSSPASYRRAVPFLRLGNVVYQRGQGTSLAFGVVERCIRSPQLPPITKSRTRFGNGVFIVGIDIAPGTYRSRWRDGCYSARLRGFSGALHAIISDAPTFKSDSAIVHIAVPSDLGFESQGCGTWSRLSQ